MVTIPFAALWNMIRMQTETEIICFMLSAKQLKWFNQATQVVQ